jgi:hypothetical protein
MEFKYDDRKSKRNKGNLWERLSKIIIVKGSYKKIIGELMGFKRM